MDEPSPKLSHLNFELRHYIPPPPRSSSPNTHRSDHSTIEDSNNDRILLDFGLDKTSHPTPFFPKFDPNKFNYRPRDERRDSLKFNLALEGPPTRFLTRPQTTLNPNYPTMTTVNGHDIRKSAFDNVQGTSQHSLPGDEEKLRPPLARPSLPSIIQVREYCMMDILN